ncbi:MAG: acetoin utilization protein AcuC [Alphaproteobacteria bacterium]
MLEQPHYIASEIYRQSKFGLNHPLSIPRVSTVTDLIRALGWLGEGQYHDSPMATPEQLARFHDPAYIDSLQRAERDGDLPEDDRNRFQLGINGNPIHPTVFRRPATACGASILAATLLKDGGVVQSPAGGTHHGRPDRASGFCYFNDPVLAILGFLDQGLDRIVYIDIDAHHGDGVQDAFEDEERVLTLSIHEEKRWPRTGRAEDRAGGHARNMPVPSLLNDDEFRYLLETVILPTVDHFAPQALVLQGGCDGLADDPMSRMGLSNRVLWSAVSMLKPLAPRFLCLGGGGYNPWAVARCWAGYWAMLNDIDIPDDLPAPARAVLDGLSWSHRLGRNPSETWKTTLADAPRNGMIRQDVREIARIVMQ